jgi:hypothetical protein
MSKITYNSIKDIVNRHDPAGLLAIGAPQDEYGAETRSIYDTVSQNEVMDLLVPGELEKMIKKVFLHYFGEKTVNSYLPRYRAIADEIIKQLSVHPCPCCGYLVFSEPPGSDEICPICDWEDDESQLRFPSMGGGANKMSLIEAQRNFASVGAKSVSHTSHSRKPTADDQRDKDWRSIDDSRDRIETPEPGKEYGSTYPKDRTELYYWRKVSPK